MEVFNAQEINAQLPEEAVGKMKTLFLEVGLSIDEIAKTYKLDQDALMGVLYYMIERFLRMEGVLL